MSRRHRLVAVVLVAGGALAWSATAPGQTPVGDSSSSIQALEAYETLTSQYVGAAEGANDLVQEVFKSLSQSSDRTMPRALWSQLGLSGQLSTYSAIYAAAYRSQFLPALAEIKIGLAQLPSTPVSARARVTSVRAFVDRLAQVLRGLNGLTLSQSSFVSHLNALLAEGFPLLGARISLVVEPDGGSVSPAPVASLSPTGSLSLAGYAVTFPGAGADLPIHATLVAPTVHCPPARSNSALQIGISLGGPISGTATPQVAVTVSCNGGMAVYSSDPALAPGEQIRPGDQLEMTILPGASRSTVTLIDTSRRFRRVMSASGIAVRTAEVGLQPVTSLSVNVSPGKASDEPSIGAVAIGPISSAPLPSFIPVIFQSCSIGGKTLASYAPPATYLTNTAGKPEVTAGPLTATRFTLSYEG